MVSHLVQQGQEMVENWPPGIPGGQLKSA